MLKLPFLLFFILTLFRMQDLYAQKKQDTKVIEIVNADQIKYDQKLKDAQRLKGNVILLHEGTYMYCDSAMLYSKQKRFHAYGHIHVKRGDSLNIFGDSLHYTADKKWCKVWNNIRLVEKDLQLTTDSIQFNGIENKAWYTGGAVITSVKNGNKLKSKNGTYYSPRKTIYFSKDVELTGKDYKLNADTLEYHTLNETAFFHGPTVIRSDESTIFCQGGWFDSKNEKSLFTKNVFIHRRENFLKGDSVLYNRKTSIGLAFGNVELKDTLQNFSIHGNKAEYNELDQYFKLSGKPLLSKPIQKDTLFVYADIFEGKQDTIAKKSWMKAFHRVKYYKNNIQGKCDSVYYNESDSLLKMFGNPVIWNDSSQITSDTILVKTAQGKIFRADLRSNCFVISQADTIGFHQLKGKNMKVLFANEEIHKTFVHGNGQCIYFAGAKGKSFTGMNKTDCSDITVRFKNNELREITFITRPDAVIYPIDDLNPKDMFLKDFNWRIKERPASVKDLYPSE